VVLHFIASAPKWARTFILFLRGVSAAR